jgi:predicted dehydrogenase
MISTIQTNAFGTMVDRRTFIKSSAATMGALAMTAHSNAQSKPIRCALLGLGHGHCIDALKVLQGLDEYEVVGVCEPDEAMRDRYKDRKELESAPRLSEEELLNDESIRMVAVESDVPRLLRFGRAAIDAGKHLHLDKPAGTSLPEFKRLLDEAERENLIVQMGYMFRYNPGFDVIRRAVKEGWLGRIYSIHASMCTDLKPQSRIETGHHPGGIMLELGCHLIDTITLLLGEPERVTPFLRQDGRLDDGFTDNTLAILEYDHTMATVETHAMEPHPFPARLFKIVGTEGSIVLTPLEPPIARIALRKPAGGYQEGVQMVEFEDLDRHVLDFQELAACIRGEREFPYSKEHDYQVQRTVLRACNVDV